MQAEEARVKAAVEAVGMLDPGPAPADRRWNVAGNLSRTLCDFY